MDVKKCEVTCEYKGRIVPRIVRSVTFPRSLSCHFINSGFVHLVVSAPWIVRVCSTNKQLIRVHFSQNPDVVVAVLLGLALHQTQLSVSGAGAPLYALLRVLAQVAEADVEYNVPGANQQGAPILIQQFEMVCMSLIAEESVYISCKIKVQSAILYSRIVKCKFENERNKDKVSLFRFKLGQINEGNENKRTGNRV